MKTLKNNYRWIILGLLFYATTVNYVDRFLIGLLADTIQSDIGWTEKQYAYIISMFQVAYGIGNIVMGYLVDRLGTRLGYCISIVLWSISSIFHVFAKSWRGFATARFGLGFGEAGNFPSALKAIAEWFPKKERALATGLFNSGSQIGVILAVVIVPFVAVRYGWRSAFIATSVLSATWLILWLLIYRKPEKNSIISEQEIEQDITITSTEEHQKKVYLLSLLKNQNIWIVILGKVLSDPVWWFYLFWGAKFFAVKYGIKIDTITVPFLIIYIMADFGGILFGWVSSSFIKKGRDAISSRMITLTICAVIIIPVIFLTSMSNMWAAVVVLGLAAAGHCGWAANIFALATDLFPSTTIGSVIGIAGTMSTFAGAITSLLVGKLLEGKTVEGYTIPFFVAAFIYLIAIALIRLLITKKHYKYEQCRTNKNDHKLR